MREWAGCVLVVRPCVQASKRQCKFHHLTYRFARQKIPIKKRASELIPYILSSSLALLLDERTISGVNLIEMTLKGGIVASVLT